MAATISVMSETAGRVIDRCAEQAVRLGRVVLPSLCATCGRAAAGGEVLCGGCEMRLGETGPLHGGQPEGVEAVFSAAHHDGVPRELVNSLKHRRVLGAAGRMAIELTRRVPSSAFVGPLVPAPSASSQRKRRGFDPATELARELSALTDVGVAEALRRGPGPRQVGRGRGERRAGGFDVQCEGPAPEACILVDDVATTGGTLTACALALRAAGARTVCAITFTRRL